MQKIHSRGKIVLAFFLVLIFSVHANCQDTAEVKPKRILTLNECIRLALDNSHQIKSVKEDINTADARKKQAESAYWPQVSAKAAYTYTSNEPLFIFPSFKMNSPPISILGYTFVMNDIDVPQQNVKLMDKQNVHAEVDLTYPLYTGGKIQAVNRQAQEGIEISKQDYKKSSIEVYCDVRKAYYGNITANKIYKIASDALERLNVTLDLTESVYKNGSGKTTRLDYLKNKVTVDAVKSIVNELKKNVQAAKDALKFMMGSDEDFELPDEDIALNTFVPAIDSLINIAYGNNPDWLKVQSAESVYQAKIDEANSGYLPSVALIGSYNQNFNGYKYGITNSNNSSLWSVGIGAEIPIFNGFRTSAEVQENRAQKEKISEQKFLLHDAIILRIKGELNKLKTSIENVNNSAQAKATAEENSDLTEKAFKQDMAEAKDMVEAQIMESLMDIQYQKSLYDYIESRINLDLIMGNYYSNK